jgi:hypothetical protein
VNPAVSSLARMSFSIAGDAPEDGEIGTCSDSAAVE